MLSSIRVIPRMPKTQDWGPKISAPPPLRLLNQIELEEGHPYQVHF